MAPEIEADSADEAAVFDAPPAAVGTVKTEAPPRSMDAGVLTVLREEAERETSARLAEAPPAVETQTELGLDAVVAAMVADDPAAQRIAALKGIQPAPAALKPQTRREMLPEIEDIKSTLDASTKRRSGEAAAVAETMAPSGARRSGFRNGFVLMVCLAALFVATYVMAPKIAAQIPGAAGALQSYVTAVDAARIWLDGRLLWAIGLMRGQS